jgi:hypothetical protein
MMLCKRCEERRGRGGVEGEFEREVDFWKGFDTVWWCYQKGDFWNLLNRGRG